MILNSLDIAPIIQEGRSLIPLRTLAQLTDSYVLYKDGVIYYAETPADGKVRMTGIIESMPLLLSCGNQRSVQVVTVLSFRQKSQQLPGSIYRLYANHTKNAKQHDEERVIVLTVDSPVAMVNQQEQAIDKAIPMVWPHHPHK